MASFDLTANINASLNPGQVRAIAARLRRQLSVTAVVDLRLGKTTARGVAALTGNIASLNRELASLVSNSTSATRSLSGLANVFQNLNNSAAQTRKTQQSLQNVSKVARDAGTQLEQFGRQAGLSFRRFAGFRIVSSAVTAFFGATANAVRESISFQRELVRIAQVSGRSLGSLSTLTNEITRLSTSLGVSSQELIGISRILTQAGLSANQTQQALEALAKSSLAPTFTDINKTAEGAIAIFRQFGLEANQLEEALSSINAVSGQFAVESDDIISAVKRAGGVFAALSNSLDQSATQSLNQFIATFTAVRATTRESADSIATGLRTIFTRIQRPTTIGFLRDLGVELTDVEGKFVGPFQAINKISEAFQNLDTRDPQFARIVEELGGFRQVSRVIPLLTEQETRLRALQVAQEGSNSLSKDAETAQQALSVQLTRVREEFGALIRELTNSGSFQNAVRGVLDLARAFISLADSIQPILPLLGIFAGFKAVSGITQFSRGLLSRGGIRPMNEGGEVPEFGSGGRIIRRRRFQQGGRVFSGGLVPGGKGVKDDFDTTLPSGAFVIRRRAVDTLGRDVLENLNNRQGFISGGQVPVSLTRGEFIIDPETAANLGPRVLGLLNNADKIKRNRGGGVGRIRGAGRQGLQNGGFVFGGSGVSAELDRALKQLSSSASSASTTLEAVGRSERRQILPNQRPIIPDFDENEISRILRNNQPQRRLGATAPTNPLKPLDNIVGRTSGSDSAFNQFQAQNIGGPGFDTSFTQFKRVGASAATLDGNLKKLNSTSRSLGGRFKDIASRTGIAAGGKKLGKLAGTALSGQGLGLGAVFAGTQVGGTAGAALSGAGAGALAGSSFGPVGTAVGATIGAITSAFNAFLDARIDAKTQQATDLMTKSLDRAAAAAKDFANNNDIAEAVETAGDSILTLVAQAEALRAQANAGIGNTIINTLAGTEDGLDLSLPSISLPDLEIPDLRVLAEKLGSLGTIGAGIAAGAGTGAVIGGSIGIIAGPIGIAVGSAVGSVLGGLGGAAAGIGTANTFLTPERFVSRDEGIAASKQQNRKNQEDGKSLKQKNQARSEASQKIVRQLLESGVSANEALEQIGPELTASFAVGTARGAQVGAIGSVGDDAESLTLVTRSIARENAQAFARQIALQKRWSDAIEHSRLSLDKFNDQLSDLGSAITRAGDAGAEFASRNAALTGSGVQTLQIQNPFANPNAFSQQELSGSARAAVAGLGGQGTEFGREIVQIVDSFRLLDDQLGNVILNAGISADGDSESSILGAIDNTFQNVIPNRLLDTIRANVRGAFAGEDNVDVRELATSARDFISDESPDKIFEALSQYNQVVNRATADYASAVGQWIELQNQVNAQLDQTFSRGISDRNAIISQDRNLTFDELTEGFRGTQRAGAVRAGAGGADLSSILRRLTEIGQRRGALQNRSQQIRGSFASPQELQGIQEALGRLALQEDAAEGVLKQIATNTTITAAATQKLEQIESAKRSSQQIAEEFLGADPAERRRFERRNELARTFQSGAQLSGKDFRDAIQGLREQSVFRGGDPRALADRQREIIARDPRIDELFRRFGGRGAGEALGVSRQERELRNIQQQQANLRFQGGTAAAQRAQGRTDEFAGNATQQFKSIIAAFSTTINDVSDKLSQIPSSIKIGGNFAVNVNVNGLDSFGDSTEGRIKEIASTIVREEIKRIIPQEQRLNAQTAPGQ